MFHIGCNVGGPFESQPANCVRIPTANGLRPSLRLRPSERHELRSTLRVRQAVRNVLRPFILTFCLVGARFITPSQVALCLLQWLRHVCLIVLRIAETYLGLFWNCAIFVGAG